jgi:hypothetical protein
MQEQGEVYLHIGTIKTGTTFLQKEVFPKLKGIEFCWKPYLSFALTYPYLYPKILISDERLSGWCEHKLDPSWRTHVIASLKQMYPDAKIIITLRKDEDEFWQSNYAQAVYQEVEHLHHYKGSFESFKKVVSKDWNNHELIIQEITSRWNDVLILDYKELQTDVNSYVKKICDFMGVEVPEFKNIRLNARHTGRKK